MTIEEALEYIDNYDENENTSDDEEFQYIECLKFMIEETHDSKYMMWLGGRYHASYQFDLSYKYYEMAAQYDNLDAYEGLGYIWLCGYLGKTDYKKAFEYFSKAAEQGNLVAEYKIADMYKEGYYVEKNIEKHEEMIEEIHSKLGLSSSIMDPVPEVNLRLARIRMAHGRTREAKTLLTHARSFLKHRIFYNAFFGYLVTMRAIIEEYYSLVEFDSRKIDIYDLFYLMERDYKVRLNHQGKTYYFEPSKEGSTTTVHLYSEEDAEGNWFTSIQSLFENPTINDDYLMNLCYEIYDWEVF